jgi:aminoglycoside phosphotransferase (APT) family kinase protein
MSQSSGPIESWVEQAIGATGVTLELIPGGGSRTSYVVRAPAGPRYLLRVDNGKGPLSGTQFTIEREFRVISALHAAALPVPGIVAYSARHDAMLMEFIEGSTSYQVQVTPEQQLLIQADLMNQIAALHKLDPKALGLKEFAALTTVDAAVSRDLATLESMYRDKSTLKEPEIDFALRWLADNIPDRARAPCLVHGDMGPGNFIFGPDGRVRALIDWEVVHMGHPLEDLAAVLCRSLGVAFGTSPQHIENYEHASVHPIDRDALAFAVILVLTRWYVGLNLAISRPSITQNIPVLLTYRQSVAYTLVCALAERHQIDCGAPTQSETDAMAPHFIDEYIIYTLDTLVRPALEDPYLNDRTAGLVKLALYRRDLLAYGVERLEGEELRAIEAVTKATHASLAAARAAACAMARTLAPTQGGMFIRYLLQVSQRRHRIWAAAMGEMAHREIQF